jgi:taurine dioxygenase
MNSENKALSVTPFDAVLGAEISGVDLSLPLSDEIFAQVEAAFDTYSVTVIRGQSITPAQQLAFAARFGALEINAFNAYALDEYPGVLKVSNIERDSRPIGYADAGSHWHSDMSYTPTPPRCTMLYAVEVPEAEGKPVGDTLFASGGAAFDALSGAMKDKVHRLKATHRFAAKERGFGKPVKLTPEQIAKYPDVTHPIVRTHPATGRKCLYVNRGECIEIPGITSDEALPLIEELAAHFVSSEFIYRHKWQVGDLLMWDNAAVQHRAIKDYDLPQRRLMHRVTVNGSAPF